MTIHNPKALIPIATAALPAGLLALDIERAADLAIQEKAPATRRAYGSDFQIFRAWCAGRGVNPLPATAESGAGWIQSFEHSRQSRDNQSVPIARQSDSFAWNEIHFCKVQPAD